MEDQTPFRHIRRCESCGSRFTPPAANPDTRFCSQHCRDSAYTDWRRDRLAPAVKAAGRKPMASASPGGRVVILSAETIAALTPGEAARLANDLAELAAAIMESAVETSGCCPPERATFTAALAERV